MCHHLRKAVSQQEGDQRVEQIKNQQQALPTIGLRKAVIPVVPALIQKQSATKQVQRKREIFLDRLRSIPGKKTQRQSISE